LWRKREPLFGMRGYASVRVDCLDGYLGFPEGAPFDRIVASVGCSDISPLWCEQLAVGGNLLVPLQHGILHPLVLVSRTGDPACLGVGRIVGSSSFMPSHGALTWVNLWQSYLIGDLPAEPLWTRPVPDGLPALGMSGNALQDPQHQSFHFYLALSSRELWDSGSGYGLADPGAGAVVIITARGVQAFARSDAMGALESLYERLSGLARGWRNLGRPSAADYHLSFYPKRGAPVLGSRSHIEWVIERMASWEVVGLLRPERI
jgi:protein-L-isoaspartate(D-aspartate) O-methyltransferase